MLSRWPRENLLLRKATAETSRDANQSASQKQHARWLWYFLDLWRGGFSAELDYNIAKC
jgi:hypothetical protein